MLIPGLFGCALALAEPSQRVVPAIGLQQIFAGVQLTRPLALREGPLAETSAARNWYVLEQSGRVLRIQQSTASVKNTVFADLRQRVESGPNEAGLLGMAFDPAFAKNGYVYLSYTRKGAPLVSILSRWVSRDQGLTLDTQSEQVLLSVRQPYANHNGGDIHFGPDGYLYFGLGDGGAAGDPQKNGQNTRTLLGSLLRLDVSGKGAYQIPADNPFVNGGGRAEIYAYGLRNPWRWSFDRQTGDLWLADVGQNAWEEVDLIQSGGNYGWNLREGAHCYSGDCRRPGLIDPLAEYSHDEGCSITGGYVYRGKNIPALNGVYLFADFCSGNIWGLSGDRAKYTRHLLRETNLNIASFGEDHKGELYIVDLGGKVFRITAKSVQ